MHVSSAACPALQFTLLMEKLESAASLSSTMWQSVQASANSISQLERQVRLWALGVRLTATCEIV